MKLIVFNQTTLPKLAGGGNRPARVAFGKAGTISFNGSACQLMDLDEGDHIAISQDEEQPENWYIFKSDENGFKVRKGYDKKGVLFNHAKMVTELVNCFGLKDDVTHNFLIAGQPTLIKGDKTKYWGIIIRSSE